MTHSSQIAEDKAAFKHKEVSDTKTRQRDCEA